ncbi:MBL fold metallo-hydrolase [Candidatus Woesearchaeota archaeon]|nr:MBL fold metallo-hydrolase [Candidatus Woesearchaeota archaeon]
MENSVLFLGTGGDSLVVGKQIRASGGIVLELEGNQFILDPGPGCLVRAKQADIAVRDTIAVLVSHAHTNHSNDVNAVIEAMSVSGLDRIGVLVCNKQVANGDDKEVPVLKKKCWNYVERVLVLEPNARIGINSINIYTTQTKHLDSEGMGFIFETPRYRIGYVSDTEYSDEIASQFEKCGMLILNCKYPREMKGTGNLNVDDAIKFIKKASPKLAVLTHFGIKMIESDPMYQAREIQRETGVEVIAAKDGLLINPVSFSSRMRQSTLEPYNAQE